jgi:hypothetical protein
MIDSIINDIIEDDYEIDVSHETYDISESLEEWRRKIKTLCNDTAIDFECAEYLSKSPGFKGFMDLPVAVFEGILLAAVSRKVFDLSEFRDSIADKSIFLHSIELNRNRAIYTENGNLQSFAPTLDKLFISREPPFWIIRYAALD